GNDSADAAAALPVRRSAARPRHGAGVAGQVADSLGAGAVGGRGVSARILAARAGGRPRRVHGRSHRTLAFRRVSLSGTWIHAWTAAARPARSAPLAARGRASD